MSRQAGCLTPISKPSPALPDPKPPATLGTAAQGVFDSIGGLSPAIKSASLGGVKIGDHIPQATSFAVQVFKAKALENELKARSKAIERELALQEAAFTLITSTLETDLAVQLQLEETEEVIEPLDRKSTRLNSSHGYISYAVFCLKKKTIVAHDEAA